MTISKYRRVQLTHGCVLVLMLACASFVSWSVWTQKPDDGFETLETVLYPFYRWIVPTGLFVLCCYAATTPLVLRTLRILKRQSKQAN